jgi:hypothetical protein
MNRESLWF